MADMTVTEQRSRIDANRERRFNEYAYYERQRARNDVITDQAERLAAPMVSTFSYKNSPQGLTTTEGQLMQPIFDRGVEYSQQKAAYDPQWQFEADRSVIEREKFLYAQEFADASGVDSGVLISSVSLDRSDYEAMRAVAGLAGYDLHRNLGSEEILSRRITIGDPAQAILDLSPIPDAVVQGRANIGGYNLKRRKMMLRVITLNEEWHTELIDYLRQAYDNSLSCHVGGEWYAGRRPTNVNDAVDFIRQQTDLIDQHMARVNEVYDQTMDVEERNTILEPDRYNLAAALEDRMFGKEVVSLADSGAEARAEGRDYSGDCPTGAGVSAAQQADKLGYESGKYGLKTGPCPMCGIVVTYDVCSPVCSACGSTGTSGPTRMVGKLAKDSQQNASRPRSTNGSPTHQSDRTTVEDVDSSKFRIETRTTIGGADKVLIDRETGKVVRKL